MSDLIRRDDLMADLRTTCGEIRAIIKNGANDEHIIQQLSANLVAFYEAVLRVKKAPAVDAKIMKHGEWVDGKCPTCGRPIPTDDRRDAIFEEDVRFCYFCGTVMDGGNE